MRAKKDNLGTGNSQKLQTRKNNLQTIQSIVFVLLLMVFGSLSASAQHDSHNDSNHNLKNTGDMIFEIPKPLKAEHDELHAMLVHATQLPGKTGEAAKAVAKVLHSHFVKEEEYALPPLGLLPQLSAGIVTEDMKQVLPMTEKLKKELPEMLAEHQQIVAALQVLIKDANAENHPEVAEFAEKLILHAQTEEEVSYPTAILIGEYIKLKLGME
jgi:hypothetical protein